MTYSIQGFQNALRAMQDGYDAERSAETLKDARKEAKYMLSDEYRRASEASDRLELVQIWKDGKLIDELSTDK